MEKFKIIAEAKSLDKKIDCNVQITSQGNVITQYSFTTVLHPDTEKPMSCIIISKKEAQTLLGVEIAGDTATIPFQNQSDREMIEAKCDEIKKMRQIETTERIQENWKRSVERNAIFKLKVWIDKSSHQITLIGLPNHLSKKSHFIATKLNKLNPERYRLWEDDKIKIGAKIIQSFFDEIEDSKKAELKKLHQKAIKTGQPQKIKSVPVEWNSHREHYSEDRYVTYIRPDGSTFVQEEKAEPNHC